jgi:ubiquinone/menaquinone biosynthesis C-methylase UbiE
MSSHRAESRTRWAAIAAAWEAGAERFNREAMPVSLWMVDAIAPQPGQQVLELSTGTGDTGLLAAELVAPGGTVTLSDFVPEMLSAAQRIAAAKGVENVRFRQIDADLPLDVEAASLDGVLSRWGYHLLADGEAALRETRRVLRPGGRVALAAWTAPEENPWSALLVDALAARGAIEPPDREAPGQFAWAREGAVAEHLDAAGFVEHAVETVDFTYRYPSVEEWWASQTQRSMVTADGARRLDPAAREEVLAGLAEAVAQWTTPEGALALPARTWVAWGEG